jgi:undecaprenyl-phosphate 4-deoxy-4-formamido-L-arabinose transferase
MKRRRAMKKISIIIPVYNSAQSLESLNRELDTYFETRHYEVEKIFVDDRSSDASYCILEKIRDASINLTGAGNHRVKIISLKYNAGQQNALFCGMHYASGDLILTMDDDLQHDIAYVEKMVEMLEEGYDLVYGVHPTLKDDVRSLGSKMTGDFFKRTYPALQGRRVSSFRIFKRTLLEEALACRYRFIYISAVLLRQQPKVGNVEISKRERQHGQSGYNLWKLGLLFFKLIWFYGSVIPECMKPVGEAYEENNDARCRQLPVKCHS